MSSIIKTVSLTPEENKFLEVNNLSPTKLLKFKIDEIRHNTRILESDKITRLTNLITKYSEFINKLGLSEQFYEFKK